MGKDKADQLAETVKPVGQHPTLRGLFDNDLYSDHKSIKMMDITREKACVHFSHRIGTKRRRQSTPETITTKVPRRSKVNSPLPKLTKNKKGGSYR